MAAAKGNKYAKGNDGGRPPLIADVARFEELAEAYFHRCDTDEEPYTITGLALGLGLSGRQVLSEYGEKKEFSDFVKKAKSKVENAYEKRLSGPNCTGAIFALKNMQWRDETQIEHSGNIGFAEKLVRARERAKRS